MSVLQQLQARGLIFQRTHEDELDAALEEGGVSLYCGFDPSFPSMHIGNLLLAVGLAHFRRHGHDPMALVGGATGLIGDPSGRTTGERELLDAAQIEANQAAVGEQLRTILDRALELHADEAPAPSSGEDIPIVNNADWMTDWSYIEFLRDVGKNFRVNAMIQKESVRQRLEDREQGMSYTEFSYMLIQAYDFFHLFEHEDCRLQIGGSDQWGNITAGTELIRRKLGEPAFGITFPLILDAAGNKLGKSEGGALWLDPELTSPYEFYQYWVQREDAAVVDLLYKFTFLPIEQIAELGGSVVRGDNRGEVQKKLAWEVTALTHGPEEADKVVRASKMLFGDKIEGLTDAELKSIFSDVPSTQVGRDRLAGGINIVDLFAESELQKSKGQARRLLKQGGGYLNNERVEDIEYEITLDDLASESMLVLRAGKKKYHVVAVG